MLVALAARLCKAVGSKRGVPDVVILRSDMSIWVSAPGDSELMVEPCELLGFNVGAFSVSDQPLAGPGVAIQVRGCTATVAVVSARLCSLAPAGALNFELSSDTDFVVRVDSTTDAATGVAKTTKTLRTVCALVHEALVKDGLADLQIPGHKLNPRSKAGTLARRFVCVVLA